MSTKLRKSIPHIRDLGCRKLRQLLECGSLFKYTITEKTDGSAFEFGVDQEGFYTRTSTSDKMRESGDYLRVAETRFGTAVDPKISAPFDYYHQIIQQQVSNIDGPWFLRGELFPLPYGTIDGDTVTFVGTPYYLSSMGNDGAFVVHTQLEQGMALTVNHISHSVRTTYSRVAAALHPNIWIYEDIVATGQIIVPRWLQEIGRILPDRLPKDPTLRRWYEVAKTEFEHQANRLIADYTPCWGPETEGFVFHPEYLDWCFKVVDPEFNQRKKQNGW